MNNFLNTDFLMFDLLLFFIILKEYGQKKEYGLNNVQSYQLIMFTYDLKVCFFFFKKRLFFFFIFWGNTLNDIFDMKSLILSFISYGQLGQRRTILQKSVNGHLYSGQSFNSEEVLLVFHPLVRSYVFFLMFSAYSPEIRIKLGRLPPTRVWGHLCSFIPPPSPPLQCPP